MLRVLQGWPEIGEAILGLEHRGLPLHLSPQKNWDHWLLHNAIAQMPQPAPLADLGCGDGYTLFFLHHLGFKPIDGVDFRIGHRLRLKQALTMYRARTWQPPYRLHSGDILRTPLESEAYGTVASISTIEHGVDLAQFFREAARLLRRDGLLFVTTDYWEEKLETSEAAPAFGLPWRIFCRDEIEEAIRFARDAGLQPWSDGEIPQCSGRPIFWNNRSYTFIAMLFRKMTSS